MTIFKCKHIFKQTLERQSNHFKIQSKWKPILNSKIVFPPTNQLVCGSLFPLTKNILHQTNPHIICHQLYHFPIPKLFTIAQELFTEFQDDLTHNSLCDIWDTIISIFIEHFRQSPSTVSTPKNYYSTLQIPQSSITSRQAIYFLEIIYKTQIMHKLSKDKLESIVTYLLASINPKTELSFNHIQVLIQSVQRILPVMQSNIRQESSNVSNKELGNNVVVYDVVPIKTDEQVAGIKTSFQEIINSVFINVCHYNSSNLSIGQLIQLGHDLKTFELYIPEIIQKIKEIVTSNTKEMTSEELISVLHLWECIYHRDVDMKMYDAISTEIMLNRIDQCLNPRNICRFITILGESGVLYKYVYDAGIRGLLRHTQHEWKAINEIVNRGFGYSITDKEISCLTDQEHNRLNALSASQIGYSDSKVFVGLEFISKCRKDGEQQEANFYNHYLYNVLTMNPDITRQTYQLSSLSNIVYPLFALPQFETAINNETHLLFSKPLTNNIDSGQVLHSSVTMCDLSSIIGDLLSSLYKVNYCDELLIKPLAQLLAMSQIPPCIKKNIHSYTTNNALSKRFRDKLFNKLSILYASGLNLINSFSSTHLLSVSRVIFSCNVFVPADAITALSQRLIPLLDKLNGRELGLLMVDIAQAPRGISKHLFSTHPKEHFMLNIPEPILWEMDANGLACLLINCVTFSTPSYFYSSNKQNVSIQQEKTVDSFLMGWSVQKQFQIILEALAQKLYIAHIYHVGTQTGNSRLPLITDSVIPEFTWAAEQLLHRHSRDTKKHQVIRSDTLLKNHSLSSMPSSQLSTIQNNTLYPCNDPNIRINDNTNNVSDMTIAQDINHFKASHVEFVTSSNELSVHQKKLHHYINTIDKEINRVSSSVVFGENSKSCNLLRHFAIEGTTHQDTTHINNYTTQCSTQNGFIKEDHEIIEGEQHELLLSYTIAEKTFTLVWTSILSYILLDQLYEISEANNLNKLNWKESIQYKLNALPLKSVSLLHDILLLCTVGLKPCHDATDHSYIYELNKNDNLLQDLKQYILKFGIEHLEPRYLKHAEIKEFIQEAIKQGKIKNITNDSDNQKIMSIFNEERIPQTLTQLHTYLKIGPNALSKTASHNGTLTHKAVRKGLLSILPHIYSHLKCIAGKEEPELYSYVPVGPFLIDIWIKKQQYLFGRQIDNSCKQQDSKKKKFF